MQSQQQQKQIQSKLQQPTRFKSPENTNSQIMLNQQNPPQLQANKNINNNQYNLDFINKSPNTTYQINNDNQQQQQQSQQNAQQKQNHNKTNANNTSSGSNNMMLSSQIKSFVFSSDSFLSGVNNINNHSNQNYSNSLISNKLTDTSQQSFLIQQSTSNTINNNFSMASRPKQQKPSQQQSQTQNDNNLNNNTNNRYQSYQQHLQQQQLQQQHQQKPSPLRFRPASPPQPQNNINSNQKLNTSNSSQSPGRIIPMKQIKIVHSPQPSFGNQNQNSISPLIYNKHQQKSNSPVQFNQQQQQQKSLANQLNKLGFGFQVSNFDKQHNSTQSTQNINQNEDQQSNNQVQSTPSQYQLLREKAHQRRRSGNSSRQQSIYEAPKNLVYKIVDLTEQDCDNCTDGNNVINNLKNNNDLQSQGVNQIQQQQLNVLEQEQSQQEEDCCQITDENEVIQTTKPYNSVPIQTSQVKQMSKIDNKLHNEVEIKTNQKQSLEEQLRKSLTDFCENQKSNHKQNSRNAKSRNNCGGSTSINEIQLESLKSFDNNILQIEMTKQSSTIPSNSSIIQSSLPLMQDGKSFFLNKVKQNTTTGNLNVMSLQNITVNFATQSTSNTTQNLVEKQTLGLNPTRSFNTQQNLQLQQVINTTQGSGNDKQQQQQHLQLCQTNRSGSNQSETFDLEMKKHGLINDLKKLDSFNQFIEKHSPKQTRQNSCSYIGDTLGGDGSCDSFRAPYIQQAKFKRAGSGDLICNSHLNNCSNNLNFSSMQNGQENNTVNQNQQDQISSQQTASFQFPFQRRARSNSPPKQLEVQNVIQQKMIQCMSPLNKGTVNHNGSLIESQYSIDQSQQQSILLPNSNGKRNGPIKPVQQNTNFQFGSQLNNAQNDWDYNSGQLQLDDKQQSMLQQALQPEKYGQLAQAIQLYLNGDYQKILQDFNYPLDHGDDPDNMLKHSTDVDEWLLSGTSENETYQKSPKGLSLLEKNEEEDNMILRKIEENQIKQAQSGTEKTYIIDDIEEDLIYVQPLNNDPLQNLIDKTYIKGDRRVTTVVEQQTWEDLEDEYDEEQNEANIVKQYEQMKSASSGDKTLQSYNQSLNNSPDCQVITSSEFRISNSNQNSDECQENVVDEDEELIQNVDLVSYEKIPDISTFRSNASSITPVSLIDLSASQYSCVDTLKNINQKEQGREEDWMYKTFDNFNNLSRTDKNASINQSQQLNTTQQQPLNNQLKSILQAGISTGNQQSRNLNQQISQHKTQQIQQPSMSLLVKSNIPKEMAINNTKQKQSLGSRQVEDSKAKLVSQKSSSLQQNINQVTRKFPARQSPREVKIDLVVLSTENSSSAQSIKQQSTKQQNSGKSEKKTQSRIPPQQQPSSFMMNKKSPNYKNNKENKIQTNLSGNGSLSSRIELVQQPKTSQPNKFMSKNQKMQEYSQSINSSKKNTTQTTTQFTHQNSSQNTQNQKLTLVSKQSPRPYNSEKALQSNQNFTNQSQLISSFNTPNTQLSAVNKSEQYQTNQTASTTTSMQNNTASVSNFTTQHQQKQQQQQQPMSTGHHKRQTSGSGHRHRRTMSTAFDPNFLEQIRNQEYDPTNLL